MKRQYSTFQKRYHLYEKYLIGSFSSRPLPKSLTRAEKFQSRHSRRKLNKILERWIYNNLQKNCPHNFYRLNLFLLTTYLVVSHRLVVSRSTVLKKRKKEGGGGGGFEETQADRLLTERHHVILDNSSLI